MTTQRLVTAFLGLFGLALVGLSLVGLAACSPDTLSGGPDSSETAHQSVVYGDDDRLEYFEAREALQAATRASVTFVDQSDLDLDDPDAIRFVGGVLSDGGICSDEPFADQPTVSGCSAFLIEDRLVATAGHCVGRNRCPSTLFAFGYYYEEEGELHTITEDDIYECLRVVAFGLDDGGDFAVIEVDRAVTSSTPLGVDTSGVGIGDGLTLIGYPSAIPAKVAGNGAVMTAPGRSTFTGSVDAFGGNSGSMVLGEDDRVVGILVAGEQDYIHDGDCLRSNVIPQDGSAGGESITDIRVVVDALCDAGYPSERLCDATGECGDGFCTGEEDIESCADDCEPPAAPETPAGWSCDPFYYGVGDDCDCDCGAYDPDCDDPSLRVVNCSRHEVCDERGECVQDPRQPVVPDEWECRGRYYARGDDCDCDCGAYDPDCDNPDLEIVNCAPGQVCSDEGSCIEPVTEPEPVPDAGVSVDATPDLGGADTAADPGTATADAASASGTSPRKGGCSVTRGTAPGGVWMLAALILWSRRRGWG